MAKCATCRWWKDACLAVQRQDIEVDKHGYTVATNKMLGYCEPERMVSQDVVSKHHYGLTAQDYSCGEHQERDG